MRALLAISAALLAVQDTTEDRVRAGLELPSEEVRRELSGKGARHRDVLKLLADPGTWAEGLRRIESKLGLDTSVFEIKLSYRTLAAKQPGMGGGRGGKGSIVLDIDALAAYLDTTRSYERRRRAGGTPVVPPARLDAIVWHELAHCYATGDLPEWFIEGVATYVTGDPHFVAFYRHEKQKVGEIDQPLAHHKYEYARGRAFFEWLEAEHGAAAVRSFVGACVSGDLAPSAAAEKATGLGWAEIRARERKWSADWIERLRVE